MSVATNAASSPAAPAPTVLLTGAAGYIGSHTWLALLKAGFAVVGVDNFSNSSPEVLKRLHELARNPPNAAGPGCHRARAGPAAWRK